jgi:hypothetical protein
MGLTPWQRLNTEARRASGKVYSMQRQLTLKDEFRSCRVQWLDEGYDNAVIVKVHGPDLATIAFVIGGYVGLREVHADQIIRTGDYVDTPTH